MKDGMFKQTVEGVTISHWNPLLKTYTEEDIRFVKSSFSRAGVYLIIWVATGFLAKHRELNEGLLTYWFSASWMGWCVYPFDCWFFHTPDITCTLCLRERGSSPVYAYTNIAINVSSRSQIKSAIDRFFLVKCFIVKIVGYVHRQSTQSHNFPNSTNQNHTQQFKRSLIVSKSYVCCRSIVTWV